jgi:phosphoribosylaminoimidazole-succinocarboxamide synthase
MSELSLPHLYSGKVRDIYDAGDDQLLMVTSDRISAFDVVMAEPIPDKGRVLTAISGFWFERFTDMVPNHLVSSDVDAVVGLSALERDAVRGRIMLCRRAEMLPIECIVRGYLSGSAWREYRDHGTMHGTPLPDGLLEGSRLPAPVFTPSTKATEGHDLNIGFDDAVGLVGESVAARARDLSVELYEKGAAIAADRGIIIADTKFELGMIDGALTLADEVLSPDSSRLWPADQWAPGGPQQSFDKQPVRDFLDSLDWNKMPPPPPLPDDVVRQTSDRYVSAYELITGRALEDWPGGADR